MGAGKPVIPNVALPCATGRSDHPLAALFRNQMPVPVAGKPSPGRTAPGLGWVY